MRQSKNIHFVTYGDSSYLNSKQRLLLQAKAIDRFCGFHVYGREDLDEKFISSTLPFINLKRGGGYWIWKPYIINKTLINLKHGDYLVYMDVGCTIRKSGIERFDEYIDMLDKNDLGCLSFEIEQELYKWNKE